MGRPAVDARGEADLAGAGFGHRSTHEPLNPVIATAGHRDERVVVFGEDVGVKGGVHGATMGMQSQFGYERVFDTSLSEEGIMGRAQGMALAGLMPVPEIQFRKYADPAHEQISDLTDATRDMHRAIISLMEELEAVDWYNQRVDACKDDELRKILAHNRDEEKEHAAMVLEWIRRKDPAMDKELRDYLFTEDPIAHD